VPLGWMALEGMTGATIAVALWGGAAEVEGAVVGPLGWMVLEVIAGAAIAVVGGVITAEAEGADVGAGALAVLLPVHCAACCWMLCIVLALAPS
jgi:hypothetical protein